MPGLVCCLLLVSSSASNLEAINALLESSVSCRADPRSTQHPAAFTALHAACLNGHRACAQRLISAGGDGVMIDAILNARDFRGRTPAALAKGRGHLELADYLARVKRMGHDEKAAIAQQRASASQRLARRDSRNDQKRQPIQLVSRQPTGARRAGQEQDPPRASPEAIKSKAKARAKEHAKDTPTELFS